MIVQGCPLVSTQLAKKLTSQRAGRLRRTQTIVQRAEPAKSQWKVKGQEPRSLFATRLATRRCESSETSGGRGRLSLNPHDDRSSYSSSSFLLFVVDFLRRLRLLLFHARSSCPSMAIFGQAMRRNATRRIPIVRSRGCIRKRRGRHRRPDASRTSSHASLNKPMRSCRVRTLRATYFCRTRGFRFDELSLSVLWVRPSLFLFHPLSPPWAVFILGRTALPPLFFYYSRSFYSWFFIRRCALGERTSASMRKPAYYFARNMHLKLVFLSDTVQ